VILIIFIGFIVTKSAYAAIAEGCEMFDLRPGCDLSGWMKLIMGDILIGAFLAILLHHFAQKHGKQLELIIKEQEIMRTRRRIFSIETLKNNFTTLIFTYSIIETLMNQFNKTENDKEDLRRQINRNEEKLIRIVSLIRDTVLFSSDVLQPETVNEVNELCKLANDTLPVEHKDELTLPHYDQLKSWVFDLSNRLGSAGKVESDVEKLVMKHETVNPLNKKYKSREEEISDYEPGYVKRELKRREKNKKSSSNDSQS